MGITVAIYLCDRANGVDYGAPAEGYAEFTRAFENWAEAGVYADRLNSIICRELNKRLALIGNASLNAQFVAHARQREPHQRPASAA